MSIHTIELCHPTSQIKGHIRLDGSKSISNRVLLIRALCDQSFDIKGLSTSDDTQRLAAFFDENGEIKDAGPAGTTFRFSTAYYAFQPGTQLLTGSDRMKKRPIGPLVGALRQLGAHIEYVENEGYPPLRIYPPKHHSNNRVSIPADTSSQFITALLLLGPTLPSGLSLALEGDIVSRSYIELTISTMEYFGAEVEWSDDTIHVAPTPYKAKDYLVEADWSAASYHYSIAALAKSADIYLEGLFSNSYQGDSALSDMMTSFGIETTYENNGVHLIKSPQAPTKNIFEWDFIRCPDIAQTLAVICGASGTQGLFTGLQTLSIKETDRIQALHDELAKVNVHFNKLPTKFSPKSNKTHYLIEGRTTYSETPTFATYHDHRMAMAFAPLALQHAIRIEDPMVVIKSYPDFWTDLKSLGFSIREF